MSREDENSEKPEERTVEQLIAEAEALRKKPKALDTALPAPEERKRVRKAYGLTQEGLAKLLKVHRITVSAWERGAYDPTGTTRDDYLALFAHMKRDIGEGDEEGGEE
ncbi:helix-turn-helix domain-containing protein [Streptomyces sp. NPDC006339]|uniref:helix-turn-helix transcriptional regulator n=1 Tax=Streptomyces sp. NPDC006339 TaxID=3156755 RepID=UPI0033B87CA5